MYLAIVSNPHIENEDARKSLWEQLSQEIDGDLYIEKPPEFDEAGFEAFKAALSQSPNIIVK